jgi:hypothetical protein
MAQMPCAGWIAPSAFITQIEKAKKNPASLKGNPICAECRH